MYSGKFTESKANTYRVSQKTKQIPTGCPKKQSKYLQGVPKNKANTYRVSQKKANT